MTRDDLRKKKEMRKPLDCELYIEIKSVKHFFNA
jgi:hypothetical protein